MKTEEEGEIRNTKTAAKPSSKDYDFLDECEPKDGNYMGNHWFFEKSQKIDNKEDSFV